VGWWKRAINLMKKILLPLLISLFLSTANSSEIRNIGSSSAITFPTFADMLLFPSPPDGLLAVTLDTHELYMWDQSITTFTLVNAGGGGGGTWGSITGTLSSQTDLQNELNAKSNIRTVNTVSANFTIPSLTSDYILNVDSTGGSVTITIPSSSLSGTYCIDVKNIGSPATDVVLDPVGSQTIDGNLTFTETDGNESVRLCPLTSNWFIY